MVPVVGFGDTMEKNEAIDLIEHAHKLRDNGVHAKSLVRASLFIAALYAYELGWKPNKVCSLFQHIFGKMLIAIQGKFFQRGTDTEQ